MTRRSTPMAADGRAVSQLREALWSAGFTLQQVAEAVHAEGEGVTPLPAYVPAVVRLLPEGDRLSTLIKLLVFSLRVPLDEARRALHPLTLDEGESLGILAVDGAEVQALLRLSPVGDLILASDIPQTGGAGIDADFVMSQSVSTRNLTNVTLRRPVQAALDVGTGNGVQALFMARHAERVTAVDTSERALAFAAFNARLNGITNVELEQGDLFEPVDGRRFGLIVSNPPFVISPDTEYLFRDAPFARDDLSRTVVRGAADHLEADGFAHVEVSWIFDGDAAWSDPLRAWVDDLGCDAWLLRFAADDPVSYAVSWNNPLQSQPEAHAAAVGRWLDYFEAEQVTAIGCGIATLRKREGRSWVRADSAVDEQLGPASDHVRRVFEGADFLESLPTPTDLLDARLRLNPNHHLEQTMRCADGVFGVLRATLFLDDGVRLGAAVDAFSAHLLSTFDGTRFLRDCVAATSAAVGDKGLSPDDLTTKTLAIVEQMVRMGFVDPVCSGRETAR